jgi:DNA polymerase III delta prime subunit
MFNIPLVEKYRPKTIDDIVLNTNNKRVVENILNSATFPNILLYGQPGTGKTTTIISLIKEFNKKNNNNNYETIHLNASDDRGIENMRTIILKFVQTNSLFSNNHKFIILDEVDYMTEHAQKCLKIIMETNNQRVVFCLICNYITKIDTSLSNKFIKMYFKSFDPNDVVARLKLIIKKENIKCSNSVIKNIKHKWNNDIRSMINYIQMNRNILHKSHNFDCGKTIEYLRNNKTHKCVEYINKQLLCSNISDYEMMCDMLHYLFNQYSLNKNTIRNLRFMLHNNEINNHYLFTYFVIEIKSII